MVIGTGTAILGAALIGGGASIIGARSASRAAGSAARAQTRGIGEAQETLQPFAEFGRQAIDPLSGLLGIGGGGADERNAFLRETPGFQFAFDEGQRAVNTGFGQAGLLGSGARAKALTRFGQGLASQTLGQERNALFQALGAGGGAATNIANLQTGAGTVEAQGVLNRNSAFQAGLEGVTGAAGTALGAFSTPNLFGGAGPIDPTGAARASQAGQNILFGGGG